MITNPHRGLTRKPWRLFELLLLPLTIGGCSNTSHPEETGERIPSVIDRDKDGIPDMDDECPDQYALTHNGCKPIDPSNDRDGDGIPDDLDKCPDEHHPGTPDGCSPPLPLDESVEPSDAGYGYTASDASFDPNVSQFTEVERVEIESQDHLLCPHVSVNLNNNGVLLWQSKQNIGAALSNMNLSRFGFPIDSLSGSETVAENVVNFNANLCNIKKAVAISSQGTIGLIWLKVENYNDAQVMFKAVGEGVDAELEPVMLGRFPLANLGHDEKDSFASIDAFADGRFIVVWADRDAVRGRIISQNGEPDGERFNVNNRALEVLDVTNVDVSTGGSDLAVVAWQERFAEYGKIAATKIDSKGDKKVDDYYITDEDSILIANNPSVFKRDNNYGVAYVIPEERGMMDYLSTTSNSPDLELYFGINSVFRPSIAIDASQRVAIGWIRRAGEEDYRVHIADIGELSEYEPAMSFEGHEIAETDIEGNISMAAGTDRIVSAFVESGKIILYSPIWE